MAMPKPKPKPKPRSTSPMRFSGDEEEDPDLQMNLDTALTNMEEAETVYPVPDPDGQNKDVSSDSDQDQADQDQADQDQAAQDYHDSQSSQLVLHTSVQSSVSLLGALGARTPRSTSTPSRSSHSRSHSRTDDDSSASILDSGSGLSGPRAKKPKRRFSFDRNNSVASCDNDEDLNDTTEKEMVPQPTAAHLASAKEKEEEDVMAQIKRKYDHLQKNGFWRVVSAKRNPTDKRPKKVDIRFSCMICTNCILACSTDSTGNLLTHVRTKHPKRATDYINLKSKNKPPELESGDNMTQPRIDQLDMLKKNRGGNNRNPLTVTQKQLDNAIVNYMVKDGQAFNMVHGEGFREFVGTLCPGKKIMSRWTATRRVREDFDRLKKRMVDMFKTVDNLAISVDGWSKNTKGFMGYTVTWID